MAGTTTKMGIPYPTSTDLVKDGATAMQSLAEEVDDKTGAILVKTQTVGTAVSSVTVTGAFCTTYSCYRILYTGGTVSNSDQDLALQLRTAGGTTSTTGYYLALIYGTYAGAGPTLFGTNNGANWLNAGGGDGFRAFMDVHLQDPASAVSTRIESVIIRTSLAGKATGRHSVATAYTSFVVAPAAGTMTGGTIRVYGWNHG